jgi:hypothetical protein
MRLGVYDILAPVGERRIGQVSPRDPKVTRDIALKVLPDSFANDANRLARFTCEAQGLGCLNHPNICAHSRPRGIGRRACADDVTR